MTDLTKGTSGQDYPDGTVAHEPVAPTAADTWAPPPGDASGQPIPAQAPPGYGQPPVPFGYGPPPVMYVGQVRGTGACIGLTIVTIGIYPLYWYYKVHDEMKRHSGIGLGGGIALLLAFFVGFVMPFFTSSEVGMLYERRGQEKPVSGTTGLWYIPGILIIVGPIVWFVKTNGALNAYWRSLGAQG
jgi:hypothetical protein